MHRQYILLALMMLFNQDVAFSHILNPTRDLPLPTCMRLLTFSVKELCVMYGVGESSEETYDTALAFGTSREVESRRNDMRMDIVKHCCLNPCTLLELMSIC